MSGTRKWAIDIGDNYQDILEFPCIVFYMRSRDNQNPADQCPPSSFPRHAPIMAEHQSPASGRVKWIGTKENNKIIIYLLCQTTNDI